MFGYELLKIPTTLILDMVPSKTLRLVSFGLVAAVASAFCCLGCAQPTLVRTTAFDAKKHTLPDSAVYEALLNKALSESRGKVLLDQQSAKVDMESVNYVYMFPANGAEASYRPAWAPKGGSPVSKREWNEASASLRLRNLSITKLPLLNRSKRFSMISRRELDHAFQEDNDRASVYDRWHSFHKRFPEGTGIVSASRPGYSANRRVAIVAYNIIWGPKAGEFDLVVLELGPKGWAVTKAELLGMA